MKRLFAFVIILLVGCQPATSSITLPAPTPTILSLLTETSFPPPAITETVTPIPTIPAAVVELKGAEVPSGFSLIKFADLYRPTAFAFDRNGRMYVTSQDGNVYVLRDEDKDGRADSQVTTSTTRFTESVMACPNKLCNRLLFIQANHSFAVLPCLRLNWQRYHVPLATSW